MLAMLLTTYTNFKSTLFYYLAVSLTVTIVCMIHEVLWTIIYFEIPLCSQVGPASVFCTFLSAPIIYVSARMALVHNVDENSYENIVNDTRTDSSIVSFICLVSGHA